MRHTDDFQFVASADEHLGPCQVTLELLQGVARQPWARQYTPGDLLSRLSVADGDYNLDFRKGKNQVALAFSLRRGVIWNWLTTWLRAGPCWSRSILHQSSSDDGKRRNIVNNLSSRLFAVLKGLRLATMDYWINRFPLVFPGIPVNDIQNSSPISKISRSLVDILDRLVLELFLVLDAEFTEYFGRNFLRQTSHEP